MKNCIITEQNKPERKSGLELLRIVTMLMIISCHTGHAPFNFPVEIISINRLWQQFLNMGAGLGDDMFIMISGYFLVKSEGLKFRKIFSLWIRLFFYSVIFYYIFVLAGTENFDIKTALSILMPVMRNKWWFVSTYFVLYFLHPYINILLRSFTRDDYKKFMLIMLVCWVIIMRALHGSNVTAFIILYCLAAYIRLWADDYGSRKFIYYGAVFIALNFMTVIVLDLIGTRIPVFGQNAAFFCEMMRPFTVLACLCLLIGFKHLDIQSRTINTIASATFGVYLIHDNEFVRPFLWNDLVRNASLRDSPYLIPYTVAVILIIYTVCTVIELTRSKIFRILSGGKLS